jgi:hypothetical protein
MRREKFERERERERCRERRKEFERFGVRGHESWRVEEWQRVVEKKRGRTRRTDSG